MHPEISGIIETIPILWVFKHARASHLFEMVKQNRRLIESMRRFLKKQDLINTVNELVTKKNPQLVSIYKEVMLYHYSKQKKDTHKTVEKMLFVPVRIKLALVNTFLAFAAIIPLEALLGRGMNPLFFAAAMTLLSIFVFAEMRTLKSKLSELDSAMPYILIDELIARKIIVLVPKKAGNSNAAVKAAK